MVCHKGDEDWECEKLPHLQTPATAETLMCRHVLLYVLLANANLVPRALTLSSTPSSSAETMSHSHSHAPGQPPHSHGPAPPQQQQQQMPQGAPQQPQKMPQPDARMQALIEASFQPVDVSLAPPDNVTAVCGPHSREKCADCDLDFAGMNRISRLLHLNPSFRCPPPAQVVTPKLAQAVNNTKEEGNVSCLSLAPLDV